jgi:periplasmic protein CpxP/Spy
MDGTMNRLLTIAAATFAIAAPAWAQGEVHHHVLHYRGIDASVAIADQLNREEFARLQRQEATAAQTAPPVQTVPAPAARLPEAFASDVEISIAALHRTLEIQPSQEALFRAYAEVMRGNAQTITALFVGRSKATDFSAPARMHWYAQINTARAEAINRLVAPFDTLYQSLSASQKALADSHFEQLRQRRTPKGAK